jgi:hypothetical protein
MVASFPNASRQRKIEAITHRGLGAQSQLIRKHISRPGYLAGNRELSCHGRLFRVEPT